MFKNFLVYMSFYPATILVFLLISLVTEQGLLETARQCLHLYIRHGLVAINKARGDGMWTS